MIDRPGKFQDEPDYVPYFWARVCEGSEGIEEDGVFTVTITKEDAQKYPELVVGQRLLLAESSDGFVYSRIVSKAVT